MTSRTPIYGIRYPDPSDHPKDASTHFGNLATDVENALATAEIPPISPAPVMVAATDSARDAFWGKPTTATDQLALQNRGATTIRTDKGTTERYFAAYNATTNPGGKARPGWYANEGQRLVTPSAASGATITGYGTVSFQNVSSFTVDGLFTPDCDNYVIELDTTAASAATNLFLQLRSAGATDAAANYYVTHMWAEGGAPSGIQQSAQASWQLTATPAHYHAARIELHKIPTAGVRPIGLCDVSSADVTSSPKIGTERAALWHGAANAFDGLRLASLGAITISGTMRVYGYFNG